MQKVAQKSYKSSEFFLEGFLESESFDREQFCKFLEFLGSSVSMAMLESIQRGQSQTFQLMKLCSQSTLIHDFET